MKVAVVESAFGALKTTAAGPLATLHVVVISPGGAGLPSSLALPVSVSVAGSVMSASAPALTIGGMFPAVGPMRP